MFKRKPGDENEKKERKLAEKLRKEKERKERKLRDEEEEMEDDGEGEWKPAKKGASLAVVRMAKNLISE